MSEYPKCAACHKEMRHGFYSHYKREFCSVRCIDDAHAHSSDDDYIGMVDDDLRAYEEWRLGYGLEVDNAVKGAFLAGYWKGYSDAPCNEEF